MAYDLEEQESLDQLKAWWEKWGTATLSVITVGCLAFATYNGWNWYQRNQGAKATAAYVQLQNAYVQKDAKNIKSIADGLMKEYPKHVFASLAALMKASDAQQSGDLETARSALNWVITSGQPEYQVVARVRLAGVELDAKKPEVALQVIEAAQPLAEQKALVEDRMGDVYYALGRIEDARKVWQQAMQDDRSDGSILPLVSLKLQALPPQK